MNRKVNCAVKVLVILGFVSSILSTPTTITSPPLSDNVVVHERDDLRHYFGHCLHKKDVAKCLKTRVIGVIDDVITSEDPMSLSLFNLKMSLNKNPKFKGTINTVDESRSFEDVISQKLKSLLESRLIQVKVADDSGENLDQTEPNEARKKKGGNKHGSSMMMSGMALMAFLAQMFLSKGKLGFLKSLFDKNKSESEPDAYNSYDFSSVAFMSGAALLLAKIALLFTALSSLKKSSGSGGGEHVVYSADVGKQGWQRSIHTVSPVIPQHQPQTTDDLPYRGQPSMPAYEKSYDGV